MTSVVGVLALQGGFDKHIEALADLGVKTVKVIEAYQLDEIDGLVIPGGESTTIIRLLKNFHILEPLKEKIASGLPVFGTCAGMILLSSGTVSHADQQTLCLMDYKVSRNDYGRQVASFDTPVHIPLLGGQMEAVFIRAPRIVEVGDQVEVLAELDGSPVMVRQGNRLASSFHPELTCDRRIHELFLSMIREPVMSLC